MKKQLILLFLTALFSATQLEKKFRSPEILDFLKAYSECIHNYEKNRTISREECTFSKETINPWVSVTHGDLNNGIFLNLNIPANGKHISPQEIEYLLNFDIKENGDYLNSPIYYRSRAIKLLEIFGTLTKLMYNFAIFKAAQKELERCNLNFSEEVEEKRKTYDRNYKDILDGILDKCYVTIQKISESEHKYLVNSVENLFKKMDNTKKMMESFADYIRGVIDNFFYEGSNQMYEHLLLCTKLFETFVNGVHCYDNDDSKNDDNNDNVDNNGYHTDDDGYVSDSYSENNDEGYYTEANDYSDNNDY